MRRGAGAFSRLLLRSRSARQSRSFHSSGISRGSPGNLGEAKFLEYNVIEELRARGFVAALTSPKLGDHVNTPLCLYAGVDPSAASLHVGNLLPLLGLLHFQAAGHGAVALIGGATGSIGDPSGRSTERSFLSPEELAGNVDGITKQVERFFERGQAYIDRKGGYGRIASAASRVAKSSDKSKSEAERLDQLEVDVARQVRVVNNLEWTRDVKLLDFLRDVGKLARVNIMLARDSVKNRLDSEQGISFTEFSYQLLQAWDFLHLHRTYGCSLQLGGSDQWGNIVAGIDLIKRMNQVGRREADLPGEEGQETEPEAYGMTIPLLTTSTGEKFGKSAGNAVWLDPTRTSIFDFYQFFLRSTDQDVGRYLKVFSMLPLSDIGDLMEEHRRDSKRRLAQRRLAKEITELVHGPEAVTKVQTAATAVYSTASKNLNPADLLAAFENDTHLKKVIWKDVNGMTITKLAVQYGLCASRGEATRAVAAGTMYVNDLRVGDPRFLIRRQHLLNGTVALIRAGSRKFIILHLQE